MRKKIIIFSFILFIYFNPLFSQREDHTWYFGTTNKGLFFDFNTNAVNVTSDHQPMNDAGCGVAADTATGDILFYSDGTKIWDAGHQVMPNGNNLLGHIHTVQQGHPCYYPDHPNQYFVFSNNGESPSSGNIYYSIVDMTLQGNGTISIPKGDVIAGQKNISLISQATESMIIIPGNGNFYWMIVPQINSTFIRVLKITNNGISLNNTFNIGLNVGVSSQVRYSNIAGKIALCNMIENKPSVIMNFDIVSGAISNAYSIPGVMGTSPDYWCGIFDAEWSPDGTKLYLSKYRICSTSLPGKLLQYDLNQPSNPPVLIANVASSGYGNIAKGLKLGPDGKIYFLYSLGGTYYLGVINNPNVLGNACNYNPTQISLGTSLNNTHKFPEFLPHHNSCTGLAIADTVYNTNYDCVVINNEGFHIPIGHTINNPCNEQISGNVIAVSHGTASSSGSDTSIVYHQPNYYVPYDTIVYTICGNNSGCDTALLIIQFNYSGPSVPLINQSGDTLCADSDTLYYQWFFNGNPVPGANDPCYLMTQEGNYYVEVSHGHCFQVSDSSYYYLSTVNLHPEMSIRIIPNPVKKGSIIRIYGLENDLDTEVAVYSISGDLLMKENANKKVLNIPVTASGIYVLKISRLSGTTVTKLIVE